MDKKVSLIHSESETCDIIRRKVGKMPNYRSEWKYICTDGQLESIRSRLSGILARDTHAGPDGSYRVHSLYFDDYRDSCAAGNESGDGIRYKYRVRYYSDDTSALHLERKDKRYGLGNKRGCPLTLDEYGYLLRCDPSGLFWQAEKPLLREFCTLMMTRLFAPKAIIDYERTAFVEPVTHIRVTLDTNISAAYDFPAFISGSYPRIPLQPVHQNILEVKFDAILPGWLRQILESLKIISRPHMAVMLSARRSFFPFC